MLVPPQAMCGLRPMAKIGRPGAISPTAWQEGERTPAISQTLGMKMPRWGSLAMSAPPVALRRPATATLLLPDRETRASHSCIAAMRSGPPKLANDVPPSFTRRAQSSGQSSRARSGRRSAQTSQFTAVPPRRPMARMSATVQGSGSRPRMAKSCGSSAAPSW